MGNTDGRLLPKSISKVFQNRESREIRIAADISEAIILLIFGIVAITIHARLKMHLQIPGNQGLIFIAIMMTGRLTSRFYYAASLSCFAASALSFLPFWGFQNIFFPITFLIPGLVIDFLYNSSDSFNKKLWFLSLIGGIAYMTIPLTRLVISLLTGFPFGAFVKYGYAIPIATHFLFGFAGALLSAAIINKVSRK